MICAAALGVCGLAVWVNSCAGSGTLRCATNTTAEVAVAAMNEPPVPAPQSPEPPMQVLELVPSLPVAPPVVPPPPAPELRLTAASKTEAAPPAPTVLPPAPALDEPPPLPLGKFDLPPATPAPVAAKPIELRLTETEPPVALPPAPPAPPSFTPATIPVAPAPNPVVVSTPLKLTPAVAPLAPHYKVYVRMGGSSKPRFEIREGDVVLLKVTCDRIDMHGAGQGATGTPGLTAYGHVKLHGSGLDGTCEQLCVTGIQGEVEIKGNVRLTCYRAGSSSEIACDTMRFHLKGAGDSTTTRVRGVGSILPASMTGSK